MNVSDDDVLLLRPRFQLDMHLVEEILKGAPGSFHHPKKDHQWVLPSVAIMSARIRQTIVETPDEPTFTTQVRLHGEVIEVIPGQTTLANGRARKFVETLLKLGPFALEVRGKSLGEVTTAYEIYKESPWEDPDFSSDPTESPPRTGRLITFYRNRGEEFRESLAIHDSGVLSYEQQRPLEDAEKTYRRIDVAYRAILSELIAALPNSDGDGAGSDGEYVDPVFISLETPSDYVSDVKLDAARPSPSVARFVEITDGWAKALRHDRSAMPVGLMEFTLDEDGPADSAG